MSETDPKAASSKVDTAATENDPEVEATEWPERAPTSDLDPVPNEPEPSPSDWPDERTERTTPDPTWPTEQDQDTWEDSAVDS